MMTLNLSIIDRNVDNMIGKKYALCKVNISILREWMASHYDEKFGITDYDRFNAGKEWLDINCEYHTKQVIERRELRSFLYRTGLEHNFLIVQSENCIYNDAVILESAYLIDGFRRLFFNLGGSNNEEVYLKVFYDKFEDSDYLKLFYIVNLWKKQDDLAMFLDRGFRLFLFVKYGIEVEYERDRDKVSHLDLLQMYMAEDSYVASGASRNEEKTEQQMNLISNSLFLTDFKLMDKMILEFDTILEGHHFTDDFVKRFFFVLGYYRRRGFSKEITLKEYIEFLNANKKEVDKIKKMSWTNPHNIKIQELMKVYINGGGDAI